MKLLLLMIVLVTVVMIDWMNGPSDSRVHIIVNKRILRIQSFALRYILHLVILSYYPIKTIFGTSRVHTTFIALSQYVVNLTYIYTMPQITPLLQIVLLFTNTRLLSSSLMSNLLRIDI